MLTLGGFLRLAMHGETLGHPLTRTESPIEMPVRGLSLPRSLLVVAVFLSAALVIGLGIAAIAAFIGHRQAATSSNP